jgi:predicted DNA repair protein MutK
VLARAQRRIGAGILAIAPWLMRGLSVAGTVAMFLVGGGILVHGIPALHHWIEGVAGAVAGTPGLGAALGVATTLLLDVATGVVAGAVVLAVVSGVRRVVRPEAATP